MSQTDYLEGNQLKHINDYITAIFEGELFKASANNWILVVLSLQRKSPGKAFLSLNEVLATACMLTKSIL